MGSLFLFPDFPDVGIRLSTELKPGPSDQRIDELARALPGGQIPADIRELLQFSTGFQIRDFDEITLDGVGYFGFEEFFPHSVQLMGDMAGNFWIVDVDSQGQWGHVFYVCHDPSVVVLHSTDLAEFLQNIDTYNTDTRGSYLNMVYEKTVYHIWQHDHGLMDTGTARTSSDETLSEFAAGLPDHFVVADLRNKPLGSGFACNTGRGIEDAVRHATELLWGFETTGRHAKAVRDKAAGTVKADEPGKATGTAKAAGSGGGTSDQPKKKGFFAKLFGR